MAFSLIPAVSVVAAETAPSFTVDWERDRPGNARTTHAAVTVDGPPGPAVGLPYSDRVEVREANGSLRWSSSLDDVLVLATGDLTGDGTDDLLAGTSGVLEPPASVAAFDGRTGDPLWSAEAAGSQTNALLAHPEGDSDVVLTGSSQGPGEGTVVARDTDTGEPLWTHGTDEPPTTLVAAGGDVVVGTWGGVVDRIDPASGDTLASTDLGDGAAVRDVAVLPSGDLVVAARENAARVSVDGSVQWTYRSGSAQFASVDVADTDGDGRTEVFFLANDGTQVHALEPDGSISWTEGEAGWRTSRAFRQTSSIQVVDLADGSIVVAGGQPSELRAFDASTGDSLWNLDSPGPTSSMAILPEGSDARIVAPHSYGHLWGVKADGTFAWRFDLAPVQSGTLATWNGDGTPDVVTVTNGYVYVNDGATGETLLRHVVYPLLPDAVATNIDVADVTGDGHPDIVATIRNHFVDGVAVAIDGATGDRAWTFETALIDGFFQPGLVLHDVSGDGNPDALFVGDRGHPTFAHAVDGRTGEEIWSYHVEDSVLSIALATPPAGPPILGIVRDHVMCACHTAPALIGLDASTGEEVWEWPLDTRTRNLVAFEDGDGFARFALPELTAGQGILPTSPTGSERQALVVRDAVSGLPLRTLSVADHSTTVMRLGNHLRAADVDGDGGEDLVYTLFTGGRGSQGGSAVGAVDPGDGREHWRTEFRQAGVSVLERGPKTPDGGHDIVVHWGSNENTLALLSAEDGSTRWQYATEESPVRFAGAKASADGVEAAVADGSRLVGLSAPME